MTTESALKRRLARHIAWGNAARQASEAMLSDDPKRQAGGREWWEEQLNQPRVVLSTTG